MSHRAILDCQSLFPLFLAILRATFAAGALIPLCAHGEDRPRFRRLRGLTVLLLPVLEMIEAVSRSWISGFSRTRAAMRYDASVSFGGATFHIRRDSPRAWIELAGWELLVSAPCQPQRGKIVEDGQNRLEPIICRSSGCREFMARF